ncbi:MAG TPA: glycosyltransferase [Candidatus Latescibacteria bacterium]|nr:glycosyltransferase [Candidatus Latescibacterota bacterium]
MADLPETVRVSLVIVTYNRADELLRLLQSLQNDLASPNVELILVDDGSTDGTVERVSHLLAPVGERATVLRQANSGPGIGRNRGILHASGQIVVFVDTDCVVHPGWLSALVEPFSDPKIGAVGGPDRSQPDDPLFTKLIDYLMTSFLTTGGIRGAKKTHGGSYHPRSFNMAVRREAAISAEGFPTIWYGEDILFSRRIARAGWRLAFSSEAWVYHRRRTTVRAWARQLFRMGRARWWMGRHDRGLLEPLYVVPLLECSALALAVGAAVISGNIGPVTGSFFGVVVAYGAALGAYAARRTRHPAAFFAAPLLFALREASYAAGSIAGIFSKIPDLTGALPRMAAETRETDA